VLNSGKVDLVAEVKQLTGGMGADCAIDITGAGAAISADLKSLRAGGRMVSVGLPTKPVTLELTNDLIYREITYTGISGRKIWQTWEDFAKVMNGPYYKLDKVMGQVYKLEEFDQAVAAIRGGAPGKMLIKMA
jgi:threonine 3-dehydrogenase